MPISGSSSQTNSGNPSYDKSQQLKTSTGSSYGLPNSNQEKDKQSFFQKWFGSQSGQQTTSSKKSGGMSWGEDVHYII